MSGQNSLLDDDLFDDSNEQNNRKAPVTRGHKRGGNTVGGKSAFDKVLLIASIITGIIASLISLGFYSSLADRIYRPLAIMVTITVFSLICSVVLIIIQNLRGYVRNSFAETMVRGMICVGIIAAASFVFEFIYELGGSITASDPGSYILIIDDSGSMQQSDPNAERYQAIDKVLADREDDFPYVVYSFNDNSQIIREPAAKSEGQNLQVRPEVGGGTAIKGVLNTVMDDIESGKLDTLEDPKVLLLSDGYATDVGFFHSINGTLKRYQKAGIAVSTVGLGSSVDTSLMEKIAKKTGGIYMNVSDVSNIGEAMKTAIETSSDRDLLSVRNNVRPDILYLIERIIFMGLLGAVAGAILGAAEAVDDPDRLLVIAAVKGLAAAILLEIFLNVLPQRLTDTVYFVLCATVFTSYYWKTREKGGAGPDDMDRHRHTAFVEEDVFGSNSRNKKEEDPKSFL